MAEFNKWQQHLNEYIGVLTRILQLILEIIMESQKMIIFPTDFFKEMTRFFITFSAFEF